MRLSKADFNARYAAGTLHIAFVGMSNIGKSYTATRLSKTHKFQLVEVDRLIREELGKGSMADFAAWQGQPYTDGYDDREAVSIGLETNATRKAIQRAKGNTLLDTTGSVIYVDKDVTDKLKRNFLIVHIAAGPEDLERLKEDYFALPKPLVWRGHYKKKDGKTKEDSILDCYPNLLNSRKSAYENLADVTLDSSFVLDSQTTMAAVFQSIRNQLETW